MQLFKHETFRLYASLYIVATTHPLLCLLPSLTFVLFTFFMCAIVVIHSLCLLILPVLVPDNCLLIYLLVQHLDKLLAVE